MTIVDTIFKALAPAIPDRVIAGHHADLLIAQFHGINPRHRNSSSAISARSAAAGAPSAARTASPAPSASTTATPTTARTSRSRRSFRSWSSATRWCRIPAAPGAIAAASASSAWCGRAPTSPLNTQIERAHCRPWGLDGGLDGTGNAVALRIDGAWKTDFPNAKVLVAQIKAGDAFRLRSGGGGGYGSPLERPVEDVRERRAPGLRVGRSGGGALRRRHRSGDVRN